MKENMTLKGKINIFKNCSLGFFCLFVDLCYFTFFLWPFCVTAQSSAKHDLVGKSCKQFPILMYFKKPPKV